MTGPDNSVELVTRLAAALRNDADDLSLYAGFLLNTLAQALPRDMIQIDRTQSLSQRIRGIDGQIVGVRVVVGDYVYNLTRPGVGASSTATIVHNVNGIALSTNKVGLDEWSTQLSRALVSRSDADSATATNLARAFGLHDAT